MEGHLCVGARAFNPSTQGTETSELNASLVYIARYCRLHSKTQTQQQQKEPGSVVKSTDCFFFF